MCRGLGVAGACEFGLPLISGRDVSSQEDLIKKKEVDWSVSCQREYGPALCNETAHTWALLQQLRHAASLRRLQQSCSSCTLCLLILLPQQPTSLSSETLLLLPQEECLHPGGGHGGGVLTSQAQVASHTLVLLSCPHMQVLFSSLCCIKARTGTSQSPQNTTQYIQTTDCSQDQSRPYRTSRNKLWVLLARKKAILVVQRQQKDLFQLCIIHTAWG